MIPKSERLVQVERRRLLVRRTGTGPPILLLPGMGMPLTSWGPLLGQLRGFECIAVALPGSGVFVAGQPVLTMSGFGELVCGLLDELNIAAADVLGLSFGGLVAQQLAHDAPSRVRGLVLVSTSCGLGGVPMNPLSWWSAMLANDWQASEKRGARTAQRLVSSGPWRLLGRFAGGLSTWPGPAGLAEEFAAASLWSSLPWLSKLAQQTLVITGTADAVVPEANAAILASGIPRARMHRVQGGGHMCLVNRATEVGPVIAAFLRSLSRTAVDEVPEFG